MNKSVKIGALLGVIIAVCVTLIVGIVEGWEFDETHDMSAWKIMFCLAVIIGILGGVIGGWRKR